MNNSEETSSIAPLLLTPKEAAKALSISERKLWSLTAGGEIAKVMIGRAVRYAVEDLQVYIKRNRCQPYGSLESENDSR